MVPWRRSSPLARWQSGHAAACKAVYAGSIPTLAFNPLFEPRGAQDWAADALSEKHAEPGECGDTLLQSCELVGEKRWVGRNVCPCHSGEVGRGLDATGSGAAGDDASIAWAQPNGNALSRPRAFRSGFAFRRSVRPTFRVRECPNRHQRQSRLKDPGGVGYAGEARLLRRRGSVGDRPTWRPVGTAHINSRVGSRPQLGGPAAWGSRGPRQGEG